MLKKFALAIVGAFALATILTAADFWTKKPYKDWTDEESQKMVTNSPWAWQKSVDTGQSGPEGSITKTVTLLWQSALPVKQALYAKSTNPQQKALLDRVEQIYLLRLQGVPVGYRTKTDVEKIKAATTLKVKGKEPAHPAEVQIPEAVAPKGFGPGGSKGPGGGAPKGNNFQSNFQGRGGGGGGRGKGGGGDDLPVGGGGGFGAFTPGFDVFFAFPKSLDFKVEDQEIEFETNIGGLQLKRKFKLKDMVYESKLEL